MVKQRGTKTKKNIAKSHDHKRHEVAKKAAKRGGTVKTGIKFLAVCGVVLGIVVFSPLFTVRDIVVAGNTYMDKAEIIRISGIYYGEPLFRMDTVAIAKRMTQDLRIEEVTVRRSMPSTINIQLKERAPVATIATDYGYADIDRQGKIIDSYKTLKKMPIPMITGTTLSDKYIGDDADDPMIKNIIFFLQQLDVTSLNQISEVAIVDADYIVAYTTKSVQIRLGKLERLEEKARLTADFLDELQENKRKIEFVDFNYTAPFIKLAQ